MGSNTFHSLRFEDGDLLVKLSSDPGDWLLLHKDIITAAMPHFAGMFRFAGGPTSITVTDPATNAAFSYYTLSSKIADGTVILSDDNDMTEHVIYLSRATPFHLSILSDGWPNPGDVELWLRSTNHARTSIVAHKALFSIIYGLLLDLNTFLEGGLGSEYRRPQLRFDSSDLRSGRLASAVRMLCVVGSYAKYYGCLPHIAPALVDLLLSHPCIWQNVQHYPNGYALIAMKLKQDELWFDALRHLMAAAVTTNRFSDLAGLLNMAEEEVKKWVLPIAHESRMDELELERKLFRLHLTEGFCIEDNHPYTASTTYFNMIDWKRNHSKKKFVQRDFDLEKSKLLARTIFSQWLAQQSSGQEIYNFGMPRDRPAGSLASAIQLLRGAATWQYPAAVFSRTATYQIKSKTKDGKTVVQQFAEDFAGDNPHAEAQIAAALASLVQMAVEEIDQWFPVRDDRDIGGVKHVYRAANFIGRTESSTYFGLDETQVPWQDEWVWPEIQALSSCSLEIASGHKLRLIGIFRKPCSRCSRPLPPCITPA